MNPAVLIATNNRKEITTTNIATLLKQTYRPEIVIVVSTEAEATYYSTLPVKVVAAQNFPLGAKWQTGVNWIANNMNISHLIITGSDDILCKDFVKRFCTDVPFVGLQSWYIWDEVTAGLYLFNYMAKQCLGGGRVYSRRMLDGCGWKLFNTGVSKLLDDQGWSWAGRVDRLIVQDEGCILAVKGNWPVMNPVSVTLRHKNAKLVKKWIGGEARNILLGKFNYEV